MHYIRFAIDEIKFWSYVEKTDNCWLWRGPMIRRGDYGRFGRFLAHRVAYDLGTGPIPLGLMVCHHCDTPRCVRPDHLFLGTHADNVADMVRKGRDRQLRGEDHVHCKLSDAQVDTIRARFFNGESVKVLANEYGIGIVHCYDVCKGIKRGLVVVNRKKQFLFGERHPRAILSDSQVIELREARKRGDPLRILADRFGVSISTAHLVAAGRTWKHIAV